MERDRRRLEEYNLGNALKACDVVTDMTNWDDPESGNGGSNGNMGRGVDPNAVDLADR